jgi:spore coat polysaccharide biosynthesis protein SpsF (cytidylyltransferase family)
MPKVIAIIQARLNSSRLPRKILTDLGGKPVLLHVVERAMKIAGVDKVVLNIPLADLDDVELNSLKWPVQIHGIERQEADVLGSFLTIAKSEKADVIMRLTGDCPLIDPYLCSDVLDLFFRLNKSYCYAANDTLRSGYPDGLDCEVVSIEALTLAAARAYAKSDREHVMTWIRQYMPCYTIVAPLGTDLTGAKWSIDTPDDLALVREIFSQLEPTQYGWRDTTLAWRFRKEHNGTIPTFTQAS